MDVMKALFSEVYTLEDWLCKTDGSRTLKASLVREEDTQSYKDFVRTTILGVTEPIIQNGTFTLSQNSYQREVVLRVIEKLIKRDGPGKNILTLGFNVMSDDSNAQVSTGVSVEYRYPNNNVNRLHFKVWKQLLLRIGDDLMMCLLEKTSIFILLAPTCYLQIAGTPIYNAWPYESGKTFPVKTTEKQSHRKRRNSKKTGRTKKIVAETASYYVTVKPAVDNEPDGRSGRKRKVSEMTDIPVSKAKRPRTVGTVCEHQFNDKVELYDNQMGQDSKQDTDREAGSESTDKNKNFEYKRKDLKVCKLAGNFNRGDSLKAGAVFQRKVVNDVKTSKTENVDFGILCTETERHVVQEHRGVDNIGENMDQSLRAATEFPDGTKEVKKTEQDRGTLKSFRPYDHLMYLPRTSTLYNRNIREKIPKSATLSSVDSSTFNASENLYTKIFIETSVHSDDPLVEVTAPGPVSGVSPSWPQNSSAEKLQEKTNDVNSVDTVNKTVNKPNSQIDSGSYEKLKDSAVKVSCQTNFLSDPYCVKSDSHTSYSSSIENRDESSFTKSESRMDNETVVKAHPSFADSRYDLLKTPLSLLEIDTERVVSKCAYITSSANISGMKRLELLMKRKESILKNRKLRTGSIMLCTKSETSPCKNEICDKKLILETGVNNRDKDSIKDTVNSNMEKSVDLGHVRNAKNASENYENGYEVNNENVSVESTDNMKAETQDRASVNGTDFASETLGSKLKVDIQVEAEDSSKTISTDEKGIHVINTVPLCNNSAVGVSVDHDQIEVKSQDIGKRPEKQSDIYINSNEEVERQMTAKIQIPVIPELLNLLEEFSLRHRRCPYKILLRHHCPVSRQQSRGQAAVMKKSVTKATVARLLGDHVHPRKVYLFLRASFLKTIPAQLLGSDHNKNVMLKNISKLVSKGKFEKVCLGQLMAGLKTSEIHWLQCLQCNSMRLHLLAKLVYWIFRDYIFILLKTYFYVTETTFIKYRLLYYRQSVWNKLYVQGFAGLLQRKILKPISEDLAEDSLKTGTSLGVGVLRFLPKQGSLRPIMNLGRNMSQQAAKKLSINQQLMDLLHILTYMKNKTPSLVGAGKFGTDDVYTSWVQYCCHWRELGRPELYFVKTDIVNCYDTVLQKKLYSVLEDVFSQIQEDFIVRKYATVMVARGNLKRTFHRAVSSLAEYEPDFVQVAREMIDKNRMHDVILVDKVLHQHETKESLLQLLQSHLFSNIIKVGLKYYIQTGGISQGSVLSTLLCSIYYADMEREFFKITEDELLMRIVDDYLYVTPSQESAIKFLNLMLKGIPEYNCQVNVEKILVNFQYTDETFGKVGCVEGLISDLSKYVFNQAKKELNSRKECGIAKIEFVLSQSSLKWLCLKAFQAVLGRHHSLFKEILKYIKHDLKLLERAKVSSKTPPIEVDVLSGLNKQFKEILG